MIALVLFLVLPSGARPQGEDWAPVWKELDRLREGEIGAADVPVIRARLAEAADAHSGDPRAELVRASLEALAGRDASLAGLRLAARRPDPFSPREHWFLAALLPPGTVRAQTVLAALADPGMLTRWQLRLSWNTAVDEARALRYDGSALPIQRILYERLSSVTTDLAADLALTYRALGERSLADQVLAETIAREEAAGRRPAGLWEQKGILALAFGDEPRARDYLGKALAFGSADAGLLISRLDLMAGRTDGARRGFRALILNQPPPDWAWRGWGTTLLPAPFVPSATKPPLPSPP